MKQVHTGAALKAIRIQRLKDKLTRLESEDLPNTGGDKLIDTLVIELNLKNDAALARMIRRTPSEICKLRRGVVPLTSSLILAIHEHTGMEVVRIRELASAE